jgi:hypothetical protein
MKLAGLGAALSLYEPIGQYQSYHRQDRRLGSIYSALQPMRQPNGGGRRCGSCRRDADSATGWSRTCCEDGDCQTISCAPPPPPPPPPPPGVCTSNGLCETAEGVSTCNCPPGTSCRRRCGPRICEVNALLCVLFPPIGCLPQCSPGLCTTDLFCQPA